jgi:hypothetical protein
MTTTTAAAAAVAESAMNMDDDFSWRETEATTPWAESCVCPTSR